jgi:hypothetical protein
MSAATKLLQTLVLCLHVLVSLLATAQTQTTARIAGTVRDAQGAVIVRAEVVVENSATGKGPQLKTDASSNEGHGD